jgi:hypothetical protein
MKKPSITELLKLLDKPALLNWANRQGLMGVDINKYSKAVMQEGISMHKQIEDFQKQGLPFLDKEMGYRYLEFMKDKKFIDCEIKLETDFFVGRCDFIFEKDEKVYVIDFKRNQKGLYLENKLQLVAYSMAIQCDKLAIVSLPDFRFISVDIENKEPFIEIIKNLSSIYKNKKIIENVK